MQNPLALSPRRAALFIATVALLLAGGALLLAKASRAGARPVAHLALVSSNPVTVAGRNFRARARVTLVLVNKGTRTRRPSTNGSGRFTVSFPISLDRCSTWTVTATQPGRSTVVLRSPAKPECAPL